MPFDRRTYDRRQRTPIIYRERADGCRYGAFLTHPPHDVADYGERLRPIWFGNHIDDVKQHVDRLVATFHIGSG